MSSGLKSSVGNSDDWTHKLQRLKLEALVKTGRDQDADEALQILTQVSETDLQSNNRFFGKKSYMLNKVAFDKKYSEMVLL